MEGMDTMVEEIDRCSNPALHGELLVVLTRANDGL